MCLLKTEEMLLEMCTRGDLYIHLRKIYLHKIRDLEFFSYIVLSICVCNMFNDNRSFTFVIHCLRRNSRVLGLMLPIQIHHNHAHSAFRTLLLFDTFILLVTLYCLIFKFPLISQKFFAF